MTVRRWEVWVVGFQGTEPFEHRLGQHLTRLGAKLRAAQEPSANTTRALDQWNNLWPDRRLHSHRWEIRRA